MLKRQLIIAYPLAIQEFLVMFSLTIFYKIIAFIGVVQLAATQIIFKIMHASFMPAIGVGQACATLVGKYLGEKKPNMAEESILAFDFTINIFDELFYELRKKRQ